MKAAQFHFWEYINGNQTFILDSYQPFIANALQGHDWKPYYQSKSNRPTEQVVLAKC